MSDDLERLQALVEFMQNNDLAELELARGDDHVRLVRAVAASAGAGVGEAIQDDAKRVEQAAHDDAQALRSPLTGTFYRAPSPEAPVFVEPGATVVAGQVLCIIESMKMMNRIESDRSGVVEQICVHNGDPVDEGDALFVIR